MDISALSTTANQESASLQTQGKQTLTQQDFLNLFTAQLKFQNPLEPLDNYQMASQMAQFSSVDALMKMSDSMENFIANQTSLQTLQASSLIGKTVQAKGDRMSIEQGTVSEGLYELSKPGNVVIQIYDANGIPVRKIEAGIKGTAVQKISWDGKDQSGSSLPDGVYTFRVVAADENGKAITVTTYREGPVTGISLENGKAMFQLDNDLISFDDIKTILG
jgi:flagellar basal-body rod modification protein FlgD